MSNINGMVKQITSIPSNFMKALKFMFTMRFFCHIVSKNAVCKIVYTV